MWAAIAWDRLRGKCVGHAAWKAASSGEGGEGLGRRKIKEKIRRRDPSLRPGLPPLFGVSLFEVHMIADIRER